MDQTPSLFANKEQCHHKPLVSSQSTDGEKTETRLGGGCSLLSFNNNFCWSAVALQCVLVSLVHTVGPPSGTSPPTLPNSQSQPLCVIAEHRAELPVPYSSSPLSVYTSIPISQFISHPLSHPMITRLLSTSGSLFLYFFF